MKSDKPEKSIEEMVFEALAVRPCGLAFDSLCTLLGYSSSSAQVKRVKDVLARLRDADRISVQSHLDKNIGGYWQSSKIYYPCNAIQAAAPTASRCGISAPSGKRKSAAKPATAATAEAVVLSYLKDKAAGISEIVELPGVRSAGGFRFLDRLMQSGSLIQVGRCPHRYTSGRAAN